MNRINNILNNELYQLYMEKINYYEKDRIFCRHGIEHSLSVARIMYIRAFEENYKIQKDIIYAVAFLHDIGRASQYENRMAHAKAGEKIAKKILCQCGYGNEEIELISAAISSHNDTLETNFLSVLLQYADKISRNCFFCSAYQACNWPESKKNKGVIV